MDAWTPEILLVGESLGSAERTRLEGLVERVPGVGIAAVTSSADIGEWMLDLSGELTAGDTTRGVLVPAYIAVRPQQLDAETYVQALELLGDPLLELAVGVQPRHFVLVLVGHQLEAVPGDRLGQLLPARRPLALGGTHLLDQGPVARGIAGVLVIGEEGAAAFHQLVQALRLRRLRLGRGGYQLLHRRQVMGGPATPEEGLLVEVDGDAVELDRLLDRLPADRHQALLPGVAQHEEVGGDGIAEQGGGVLALRSRKGCGTTVEMWLPVAEARLPGRTGEVTAAAPQPGTAPELRVLVVDDDALVRMNTGAMLENLGHSVIEAASGEEALSQLRNGTEADLVITDQAMPHMTGMQLAKAMRNVLPDLPIILASGYAEMEEGEHGDLSRAVSR
jgi:CheY-like chemotaxis protein